MLPGGTQTDDGLASPGHALPAPKARDPRTALFVQGLLAASAACSALGNRANETGAVMALGKRLLAGRNGPVA